MKTPASPNRVSLCCVIDRDPRFRVELVLWTTCAKRALNSDATRLIVYFVDETPTDLARWLERQGVEIRQMTTLLPGSGHCNKIAPFLDDHDADTVVFTDADLYMVRDPTPALRIGRIQASRNNHAVPPPQIFRAVLEAAGFADAYRPDHALFVGPAGADETHANNINAGFIAIPAARAKAFAQIWRKWAAWLVAHRDLLGRWPVYVDQVSFALAMEELGERVEFLPPQVNAILHALPAAETVDAFHLSSAHIPQFAQRFTPERRLSAHGLAPGAAHSVSRLNESIDAAAAALGELESTRAHRDKFLNPNWARE